MDADHHLGILGLLLVGTLRTHLFTIGIDRLLADFVGCHDGGCQQLKQSRRETLTTGRIADDQRRVIQASQFLWAMIETIGTSRHQCHQQTTSHEQCRWILVALQTFRDIFDDRIVLAQCLYLSAPVPEALADVSFSSRRDGW